MAPLRGFEPPTSGLEIRCSILLSYRGMKNIFHLIRTPHLFQSENHTTPNSHGVTRASQEHYTLFKRIDGVSLRSTFP